MKRPLVPIMCAMPMLLSCSFEPGPQPQDLVTAVPWNGRRAAASLTFDDGGASHLAAAIPELDQRGLTGTFFVISDVVASTGTAPEWAAAALAGHEIGNHTKTHANLSSLALPDAVAEIDAADSAISAFTGKKVLSFCYPYCAVNAGSYLAGKYAAARGIWAHGFNEQVIPADHEPDWSYISSLATRTAAARGEYRSWIDLALGRSSWTVFQIHGVGAGAAEFEPISIEDFRFILDALKADEDSIWIDTFGTVASYLRASFILKYAAAARARTAITLTWSVPAWYPAELRLKVRLSNALREQKALLEQDGTALVPDADSVYALDFSRGSLRIAW